ncbi:MAG: hypothetical protein IKX95_09590 [Lachnospiraceae bacterium]|nr:hypothetical protein [Lachnospiraceae bacterium]MBR5767022.1 hypothetical protein [Lachnospiraceae bacterium]
MKNKFVIAGLLAALALTTPTAVVSAATTTPYSQAEQALLLSMAANQDACSNYALASYFTVDMATANQLANNSAVLQNLVVAKSAVKPVSPADIKARNLERQRNKCTIEQARIAAVNSRAIANVTLARLNDVNALLNATKVEVKTNPGLTQRLNELTALSASLQSQYVQQNKNATTLEAEHKRLQLTLPTDEYNTYYYSWPFNF